MLVHGVVLRLPAVENDAAVGADDVVVFVRRLGKREEAGAGEALGRGLVLVELPVEVPLQERRDPVVVLEVGLEVALDLLLLGRHNGGWIEVEMLVFVAVLNGVTMGRDGTRLEAKDRATT